jgi:hypothetical protein
VQWTGFLIVFLFCTRIVVDENIIMFKYLFGQLMPRWHFLFVVLPSLYRLSLLISVYTKFVFDALLDHLAVVPAQWLVVISHLAVAWYHFVRWCFMSQWYFRACKYTNTLCMDVVVEWIVAHGNDINVGAHIFNSLLHFPRGLHSLQVAYLKNTCWKQIWLDSKCCMVCVSLTAS